MSVRRNVPIDLVKGTYREVKVVFSDKPDLTEAEIKLIVKPFASSLEVLFEKLPDFKKSKLNEGIVMFVFLPEEFSQLESRTYYYEIHVDIPGDEKYIPLIGEIIVY